MFRTIFPSITRSTRLYDLVPPSKQEQYLFDIRLLLYVQSRTPDDGRKDRPKHVELFQNKINLFETLVHLLGFTIEIMYTRSGFRLLLLEQSCLRAKIVY